MNLGPTTRWYHRGIFVLLLLFFVLGPLAIPLLWQSPDFNKPVKIALTFVVLALTVFLTWKIILMTQQIMEQFKSYAVH